MKITDWPRAERPRERLLQHGAAALSDAELLAIFLHTGTRRCNVVELARRLLARPGGLRALLEADQRSLCAAEGIGPAKYAQLQAVLEMARRYLRQELERGETLSSPAATRRFLSAHLRARPHEVFVCLFLDNRHRLLQYEELFRGTVNGASVHPREVVKRALFHNAAALIVAHNHPSGVAEPSRADTDLTQRLKQALSLVDVQVLDHLVVGDGEVVSMAERGLM